MFADNKACERWPRACFDKADRNPPPASLTGRGAPQKSSSSRAQRLGPKGTVNRSVQSFSVATAVSGPATLHLLKGRTRSASRKMFEIVNNRGEQHARVGANRHDNVVVRHTLPGTSC